MYDIIFLISNVYQLHHNNYQYNIFIQNQKSFVTQDSPNLI